MTINTFNFGYAGWLVLKGYEIISISPEYGIDIALPDSEELTPRQLKEQYNESECSKYNFILRDLIKQFNDKKES